MSNLAIIEAPELKTVDQSKAEIIRKTFEPMAAMLEDFDDQFSEIMTEKEDGITQELTSKAKRLRLDIRKVRTETEKIRKVQKEEYLRAGNAIDGVSNILKWAVIEKETKLEEIEKHFEIEEQKRLDALQRDRVELLLPYDIDASLRKLSELDEDTFEALLSTKKRQHEELIEAQRKAEEERILREKAEAEERERIRVENARLKAEAEERERLARVEAEKREKEEAERKKREAEEQRKRDEAARIEREKHEAALRKQREENEARLRAERAERERLAQIERKEREKRERLEAQIKAEKEAERKRTAEEQKRKSDAELQRKNRNEIISAISEIDSGELKNCERIVDAIIAGRIPHIKYVG